MFDHVTCELPMPDGRELAKDSFQTTSLHCLMDLFTITAAGRLIFHQRRYGKTWGQKDMGSGKTWGQKDMGSGLDFELKERHGVRS